MSKIVMVPMMTRIPPAMDATVVGGIDVQDFEGRHLRTTFNLTAQNKQIAYAQPDPWYDYSTFYGNTHSTTLSVHEEVIENKFWARRDLIDWIEANIQGPVLVQRQNDGAICYRFGFTSQEDYARFNAWWTVTGLRGYIETITDEPTFNEMQVWLRENVKGGFRTRRAGYGRQPGEVKTIVIIRDLTEAAAFRLFWPGATKQAAA